MLIPLSHRGRIGASIARLLCVDPSKIDKLIHIVARPELAAAVRDKRITLGDAIEVYRVPEAMLTHVIVTLADLRASKKPMLQRDLRRWVGTLLIQGDRAAEADTIEVSQVVSHHDVVNLSTASMARQPSDLVSHHIRVEAVQDVHERTSAAMVPLATGPGTDDETSGGVEEAITCLEEALAAALPILHGGIRQKSDVAWWGRPDSGSVAALAAA